MGSKHYTIGHRIGDVGGYTSGFDYLRLILAVSVLYGHSFVVTGDAPSLPPWMDWIGDLRSYLTLPIFFSLSGFLVAASLERVATLRTFLALRAIRIAPALAVEITLSALILGPLLTTEPLANYFSDPHFFQYFLNIAGWIHYILPGVFVDNHIPNLVNGSLWTVPYEAECYVALALLACSGALRYPRAVLSVVVAVCVAALCYIAVVGDPEPWRSTASGRQLVLFFLSGVMIYRLRDVIPYSGRGALGAFAICAVTVQSHTMIYVSTFFAAYLTVYLGLRCPRKLPVLFTGDYSYGIYLYAFPIQQALYRTSPALHSWLANFLVSLALAACFAAFSWHAVEKPALRLKRFVLNRRERGRSSSGEMISPDKSREAVAVARNGRAVAGALPARG